MVHPQNAQDLLHEQVYSEVVGWLVYALTLRTHTGWWFGWRGSEWEEDIGLFMLMWNISWLVCMYGFIRLVLQ